MPKFLYKIITEKGKIKEGHISALTKGGADKKLTKDGSIVVYITSHEPPFWMRDMSIPWFGFSTTAKINFFRNLSLMAYSGISIVESLMMLASEIKNSAVRKKIQNIANNVKNGKKLSKAMALYPKYFSQFIVETVNMGEVSGRLSESLDRVAMDLERNADIKRKVVGAMMYPLVVVSAMSVVIVVFIFYILPDINKIYVEMKAPLPWTTQALLVFSEFVKANYYAILAAIFVFLISSILSLRIKKVAYVADKVMLSIPVTGQIVKEYNLVLFFRSIQSLIKSGVSLVESVNISKKTIKNAVYEKALDSVQPILLRGIPLSDVLVRFPHLFTSQTVKIIEVGERTGRLENSFERITSQYEAILEYKIKTIMTTIEPILMLMLGLVVALLAMSVFLPIYNLVNVY